MGRVEEAGGLIGNDCIAEYCKCSSDDVKIQATVRLVALLLKILVAKIGKVG